MGRKSSRERSSDSLKHKSKNRVIKAILIVVEGPTEAVYFEYLRDKFNLKTVEVEIEGKDDKSAPISIVNTAIKVDETRQREVKKAAKDPQSLWDKPGFEEVWCVFDRERPEHNHTFAKAVDTALAHNIKLALSNPSFEYWFLLHFEDTTRSFSESDEVEKYLNTVIPKFNKKYGTSIREYGKDETKFIKESLPKFVQLIFPQLEQALARATKTMPERISNNSPNPSTGVGKLVETLKAMKRY